MKKLFSGIWEAPAATIAGGICASLAVLTATDAGLPQPWVTGLLSLSAFLAVFSGKRPQ